MSALIIKKDTPFWRKEEPVLDNKGIVIKGGMWKHQYDWWHSNSFIKALVTGYGGGKTFIGGKRIIAGALTNAPVPSQVVCPSYKMAKRTVIPTLNALLKGKQSLLPELKYKFNKTDHEYKIWYKGREAVIWIGSGDDPDSLKGPNIGSAWIDEPFIQDVEVFTQMIARVRDPNARIKEIALTGTPEQLNWGYEICEGEEKENYDIQVIHASTKANLALSGQYSERLEGALTEVAAQAYIGGQFVNLQTGLVYYGFSKERNVKKLPDPGGELFVGMDFNVNPMAAVVFWVQGDHMHFIDEIELPNADTDYMCGHIREKYRNKDDGLCRVRTIFPDASGVARSTKAPGGKSDFYYIKQNGFSINAPHANPSIRDRENACNGKLSPKKGEPTITISPNCKKLIGYFMRYNHEEKHKQKAMSHLLDAFGYPVHRLFPVVHDVAIMKKLQGF